MATCGRAAQFGSTQCSNAKEDEGILVIIYDEKNKGKMTPEEAQ